MNLDSETISKLIVIGRQAGNTILPFFKQNPKTTLKKDHTPVTEADKASHTLILSALLSMKLDIPIISEE
ncbi:MAG: 3'(2'),5'-bisphosphate nucleotidase CysQ, partial [Candidatus Margulisbacteria bacterium]|nr:3'(2'),5'-bisphosphate nucleotidase CysQ [Candidatus Margulisiibacteriota bacterium]